MAKKAAETDRVGALRQPVATHAALSVGNVQGLVGTYLVQAVMQQHVGT